MRYNTNITTIIFFLCTWGYFYINIFVAWFTSLAPLLLLIRDSWIFLLVLYLLMEKKYISLFLYFSLIIFGLVALVERHDVAAFKTAFYGVRDISLYFLVGELLISSDKLKISLKRNYNYVRFILFFALTEILMTTFLGKGLSEVVFNTSTYFRNKGVDSNLSTGFLGDRLSVPLYSSALVCTLLSTFYLFDKKVKSNKFESLLAIIVSVFTLSKVFIFVTGFRFLGQRWKLLTVLAFFALIPILLVLDTYRKTLEIGMLSYHLASTFHHIKAFYLAFEVGLFDIYPNIIGSHSVAGKGFLEIEMYTIESSFLTRILDLKIYSVFFILYLIYTFKRFKNDLKSKFYFMFILLMSLTATSNHPVVYLPFIYYLTHMPRTGK